MTQPAVLPDFDQIVDILQAIDSYMDAAELHGLMTGSLCFGVTTMSNEWLEAVLGDAKEVMVKKVRQALQHLFDICQQQLRAFDFEFELLLPAENEDINIRLEALSMWCQGFLLGVKLTKTGATLTPDVQDALKDIAEVSKADLTTELTGTQEDEESFVDLSEYVRMAVMLVFTEANQGGKTVYH